MIVRVNKTSNYTVISNNVFKDQNLSLKAKGLLTTILSLPDNWKYSIDGLTRLCADGRNTVATAINELIKAGYIVRTQKFDEAGKFSGYIYDIYEEIPSKIADLSYAEKPFTEKPFTENQQQLNTNISNTNILNTKSINNICPRNSRFIPPTVEEVRAYCQERNNNVDPEKFVAFYTSNGWKVGKNPMKSWRAAVITWEKKDRELAKPTTNYYAGNPFDGIE